MVGFFLSRPRSGSQKVSVQEDILVDTPTCIYLLHKHGQGYTGPMLRTMRRDHTDTIYAVLLPDTTNPAKDSVTHKVKLDSTGGILYHTAWFRVDPKFVWVVPIGD